jgi:hemerythrin
MMNPSPGPLSDEPTAIVEAEHHVQVGLAQALRDTVHTGKDAALAGEILDQLAAYSDVHFLSEQLLMRLCGYPDYDDHVLDHDRMMERLEQVRRQHGGEQPLALAEAEALLALLAHHISTRDRIFTDYYRAWTRHDADPGSRSSSHRENSP